MYRVLRRAVSDPYAALRGRSLVEYTFFEPSSRLLIPVQVVPKRQQFAQINDSVSMRVLPAIPAVGRERCEHKWVGAVGELYAFVCRANRTQ